MSQHWCMLEGGSSSLLSCLHNNTRKIKVRLHDVKVYCYLNESWPALWVYPKSSSNSPRVKELHDSWGVRNSGPLFGLWSSGHNSRGQCSCFGRMHLIICENKACLWSSDTPGDRNTLFVACWTHQVYPLLNNAVLLYLATVHSMPSVCWAWEDLGGDSARASLSRAEVYMEWQVHLDHFLNFGISTAFAFIYFYSFTLFYIRVLFLQCRVWNSESHVCWANTVIPWVSMSGIQGWRYSNDANQVLLEEVGMDANLGV